MLYKWQVQESFESNPPSNTIKEIQDRILLFVENYRKQNKKLRISKQIREEMKQFNEAIINPTLVHSQNYNVDHLFWKYQFYND